MKMVLIGLVKTKGAEGDTSSKFELIEEALAQGVECSQ